jgi:hypothetical protein
VDEPAQCVGTHQAEQPQNQKDDKDCPKHVPNLLKRCRIYYHNNRCFEAQPAADGCLSKKRIALQLNRDILSAIEDNPQATLRNKPLVGLHYSLFAITQLVRSSRVRIIGASDWRDDALRD